MKNEIARSFEDDKKFEITIVPMETSIKNVTGTDLIETVPKDEKLNFLTIDLKK